MRSIYFQKPIYLAWVINVYNESFLKRFGENLREVREKKELSQRQLAELAKIDFTQIGRIERGEINTTLSTIYTIAKALEVHPAKLLTFEFKEK